MTPALKQESKKTSGVASDIDRHVGQRVKIRRSFLGLSQTEIAEALDLSFQQVQKYERGTNRISAGRLYELSKFLDVPINYFFEGYIDELTSSDSVKKQPENIDSEILQDKETVNLVKMFYSIQDETVRKNLLSLLKTMIKG